MNKFHMNQKLPIFNYTPTGIFFEKIILNCKLGPPNLGVRGECLVVTKFFQVSYHFSMIFNFSKFHDFPGVLSFFQVCQVEWERFKRDPVYCKLFVQK